MTRFFANSILMLSFLAVSIDSLVGQEVMTAEAVMQKAGTQLQQKWLSASVYERVRMAEEIGEKGAREFAKTKGYLTLYDGMESKIPQGPDQVYRTKAGKVIVYEAKGGTSSLSHAYGHPQGSSEWAVESAKRVLRSPKIGPAERAAAEEIIEAAAKKMLEVHVIRTSHVLGEPVAAVLESVATTTDDAAALAQTALTKIASSASHAVDDVARPAENVLDDAAKLAAKRAAWLKIGSRSLVVVGVVIDASFRTVESWHTECQYEEGKITGQQRKEAHARNAAGMAGGLAGGWVLGQYGAVQGAALGTAIWPGPGTVVCGVIGGVTGGVVGYIGGDKAAGTVASWTMGAIHATGTTIAGVACAIGNGTCVAAGAVKDGVCVVAVAVKDGVCVAASAVKVGACAVGNGTCAASRSVAGCVKRTWNWAWGY